MDILITGVAGFIGFHLAQAYLSAGHRVIGIDDLSGDTQGRNACAGRMMKLRTAKNFGFMLAEIAQIEKVEGHYPDVRIERCIHLAAEAGVQRCYEHAFDYVQTNMRGFDTVAAWCAERQLPLIYASSASVYGNTCDPIMHENLRVMPANLYGFTKYYNELSAAKFAERDGLKSVGLRFFNVYGPEGRPDSLFMKLLNSQPNNPVMIYGNGEMQRDWTHVSDIVRGIMQAAEHARHGAFVFNLGASNPHTICEALDYLERAPAAIYYRTVPDVSAGEIYKSYADIAAARLSFGYAPQVELRDGIKDLVRWFNATRL